jgi:hypothetical protein
MIKFFHKKFCSKVSKDFNPSNLNICSYLKQNIPNLYGMNKNLFLKEEILNCISTKEPSLFLFDQLDVVKTSSMVGIMNHILNNKENEEIIKQNPNEFFLNCEDVILKLKENSEKNKLKKNLKPRGALIISEKIEFTSQLYRICRKLDPNKELRMIRLGTSLHSVNPTIELEKNKGDESSGDSDESKKNAFLAVVNLICATNWNNIDILFISLNMIDFVINQKDSFDYFDVNPEIIYFDDYNYMIK